jgi:hypothetical protein
MNICPLTRLTGNIPILTIGILQINTALRREIKNTPHKDGKSKQTESYRDDEITKTNER